MKNRLDLQLALRAFQKIIDFGTKKDNEYILNGLIASTDFDGYTLFIRDEHVCLSIFFHHKYELDSDNQIHNLQFFEKMENIDKKYKQK
ncbi:DUF3081 family protein [Aliikangiella maris]|uniref:DUF3081 family protein n=2 Tax=Aliikangiella maris TaxID=3162458 RepID=A0ABV2BUU2_9GAMM